MVPLSYTFYWQMVPLSHTEFTTLHPFFKNVVNALSFKIWKISQKQVIFSTIHSQEIVLLVLYVLQTEMTDFPILSYTSTSKIPTLSYTWCLKKIAFSGGAFPYWPL